MSENNRFNLIDDEWIGLDGAEYLTAIEDSNSIRKTVYFAYNENAKGICDLLNKLDEECEKLSSDIIRMHEVNANLSNSNHELRRQIHELKTKGDDCTILNEYRQMVHSILQSTYNEIYKDGHLMNNLSFIDFARKFGYDIRFDD
jgi:hypothetical protein